MSLSLSAGSPKLCLFCMFVKRDWNLNVCGIEMVGTLRQDVTFYKLIHLAWDVLKKIKSWRGQRFLFLSDKQNNKKLMDCHKNGEEENASNKSMKWDYTSLRDAFIVVCKKRKERHKTPTWGKTDDTMIFFCTLVHIFFTTSILFMTPNLQYLSLHTVRM